jgi:hypothetical protein
VTKDTGLFEGEKIVASLASRRGHVGQVALPECRGTGLSTTCVGHASIKGVGNGLPVTFSWFCSPVTGACDKFSMCIIDGPQPNEVLAVMTLKTSFLDIKKHAHFPVLVHVRPHH